jgi:GTP pyrophosphokinase
MRGCSRCSDQRQTGDSSEFLEHIRSTSDKVYVFTPKGRIVSLPRGATAVDFAYSIHTDVGNKCVAARINNEIQPLRTELKNGDMIEIVTGPVARPNPAWLSFVRTGKARSEIRHFLRTMKFDESVELGERLLSQAARQFNLSLATSRRSVGTGAAGRKPPHARNCSPTSASGDAWRPWSRDSSR